MLCDVYVLKTLHFGTLTLCAATFCNIMSCDVHVMLRYVISNILKFIAGVNDTAEKPFTSFNDTANKCFTSVVDTVDKHSIEYLRKFSEKFTIQRDTQGPGETDS